jgi:hypothetical protein
VGGGTDARLDESWRTATSSVSSSRRAIAARIASLLGKWW